VNGNPRAQKIHLAKPAVRGSALLMFKVCEIGANKDGNVFAKAEGKAADVETGVMTA
jgi:hypothetical protein